MNNKDKNLSGYIISAALFMLIICVPLGTLARMALQHIPITQYSENILGKFKLIGLNTRFTQAISGGEYMESNEVLLGKDGWLFYKTDTDGEPLYDYMGINSFSDDELAAIYGNIDNLCETIYSHKLSAVLNAAGDRPVKAEYRPEGKVYLAVLMIPNKEQVYSEYMPATVEKISGSSRLNQLSEYVAGQGHKVLAMDRYVPPWTYTDASDVLYEVHNDYPLYYKTDTHWTDVGAYLTLTTVLDSVNTKQNQGIAMYDQDDSYTKSAADILDGVEFACEPGFVGDLTKISATQDRFPDVTYKIDGDTIPDKYKTNKKLLIVGDSFGDSMQHVAKYCFSEVRFLDIKEYGDKFEGTLADYDPDLVILECVERYLPRLTELTN